MPRPSICRRTLNKLVKSACLYPRVITRALRLTHVSNPSHSFTRFDEKIRDGGCKFLMTPSSLGVHRSAPRKSKTNRYAMWQNPLVIYRALHQAALFSVLSFRENMIFILRRIQFERFIFTRPVRFRQKRKWFYILVLARDGRQNCWFNIIKLSFSLCL